MDAQFNSSIGFLILEELKWIRKDLTEEMKSIKTEIINLGYKLPCPQSDNLNTSDHPNDCQEELFDTEDFFEDNNTYNEGNNDIVPEYRAESNLDNYDLPDTEQSNLNVAQPDLETSSQESELPGTLPYELKFDREDLEKKLPDTSRAIKLENTKSNDLVNSKEIVLNYSSASKIPINIENFQNKEYVCTYCHKMFGQYCRLKQHFRIHTGEKPFKCNSCDKVFAWKGNLKKHARIHTGERFVCRFCGKGYTQPNNLKYHIRTVHKHEESHSSSALH